MAKGSKELISKLEKEVNRYLMSEPSKAYLAIESAITEQKKTGNANSEFYKGVAKLAYDSAQHLLDKPYEKKTKMDIKTAHRLLNLRTNLDELVSDRYEKEKLEKAKKIA